jgi:hypothetical protein
LEADFTGGRPQIRHSRPGALSSAKMANASTSNIGTDPSFAREVALPDSTLPDVCDMKRASEFIDRAGPSRMKIRSKTVRRSLTRTAIAIGRQVGVASAALGRSG